jgi:hypothetical protein
VGLIAGLDTEARGKTVCRRHIKTLRKYPETLSNLLRVFTSCNLPKIMYDIIQNIISPPYHDRLKMYSFQSLVIW